MNIWARKPVEELCSEAGVDGEVTALPRSIGVFALTCIGVGATVGAGIFVLTGSVAAEHSGPAVGISLLLASIVCLLAGLCYAELAAMIPVAGSAYSYTYATLGEGIAWTVGWCLMLEYLFSASLVAISWAGYAQSSLHQFFGMDLPAAWMSAPFDVKDAWHIYRTTTFANLPALLVTVACTLLLLGGLKTSARVNNVMVVAKVIAILVVVFVGAGYVHTSLWHPYIPPNTGQFGVYGWSGVFQGTAILFFAYIGFDAVSTMGQETRNPQRTVPLSLLLGLGICAALYLAVSFVVTGLVGYKDLDVPDPMYLALDRAGPAVAWAKYLVGFVAVVGLVSVLLVTLMGQVRIFYAMGRDGLLPAAFARVHPRTRTPHIGTIVTGVVSSIAAGLLPLALLNDIISMGTLLAFGIVCGGVLVLRRTRPDLPRPFKAPGGSWVPLAGALCCAGLMATLPRLAWIGFIFWLVIGLAVYAWYGATRSKLQRATRA
ncbi:MAG TPA: amino acid permease [Steroidobacteraceae bacterium]|nr:amino acid permease [Steroidobacteraceae bacterium]